MQLAEFFSPRPDRLWQLAKQMDVNYAVSGLAWEEKSEKPWDLMPLIRMKQRFADSGINLAVIESMPPSNEIKLGTAGRDAEIETFQQFIVNMGRAGIPVLCYNFMAQFNWFRTSTTTRTRGGALVSSYDHSLMRNSPLTEAGIVSEQQLWENLHYFMEQIVPVAEEAKVKLALHPDDPPITPIRGVSRILRSADALQRAIDLVPSAYNGITLCQGTLATAGSISQASFAILADRTKCFLFILEMCAAQRKSLRKRSTMMALPTCWRRCTPTMMLALLDRQGLIMCRRWKAKRMITPAMSCWDDCSG